METIFIGIATILGLWFLFYVVLHLWFLFMEYVFPKFVFSGLRSEKRAKKTIYWFYKKFFFCLVLLGTVYIETFAQSTISYGQISCYCPQTGQTLGGGGAVAITFYDGYISHTLYGKLQAVQRNNDGSITYVPVNVSGTPTLQLNAVLISSDLQRMEERITSTFGNMSLNMINTYTSMGKDGGQAAQRWAETQAASKRGGTSSRHSSDDVCQSCGGTGVSKTPNSGGSRTSWIAYYNSQGNKCPYCGRYTSHFHDKCSSCNVPSY
jgi:rRNA maturation protein Nop10